MKLELKEIWACVWSQDKGGFSVKPAWDLLRENTQLCLSSGKTSEVVIGLFGSMEEALVFNKIMKRRVKENGGA